MTPRNEKSDHQEALRRALEMLDLSLDRDDRTEAAHWREEARQLQMILRKEARDAELERHLIARFGRKG